MLLAARCIDHAPLDVRVESELYEVGNNILLVYDALCNNCQLVIKKVKSEQLTVNCKL